MQQLYRKKGSGDLSQALRTKMDEKLDDINLDVETLNKEVEKSNEFFNSIKAELSEFKIKPLLWGQLRGGKCSTQAQMTMEWVSE